MQDFGDQYQLELGASITRNLHIGGDCMVVFLALRRAVDRSQANRRKILDALVNGPASKIFEEVPLRNARRTW